MQQAAQHGSCVTCDGTGSRSGYSAGENIAGRLNGRRSGRCCYLCTEGGFYITRSKLMRAHLLACLMPNSAHFLDIYLYIDH